MVYADTILTLVLPAVIMSVLMVAMATTSISTCQRRRRQSNVSATSYKSPLTKVTNMLLAVTLIFFTLNLPSHAVRMGLMISTFVEREQITPTQPTDITMQSISQMLYYLSMSINIFIYYLFGRRFRKTFKELFTSSSVKTLVQTDKRHDTLPLVVSNSELSLRAMTRKNGISLHPGELMSLREMQICKL
jgi:protein-S-isoprenylcysteine O-methyltransferase Ste14